MNAWVARVAQQLVVTIYENFHRAVDTPASWLHSPSFVALRVPPNVRKSGRNEVKKLFLIYDHVQWHSWRGGEGFSAWVEICVNFVENIHMLAMEALAVHCDTLWCRYYGDEVSAFRIFSFSMSSKNYVCARFAYIVIEIYQSSGSLHGIQYAEESIKLNNI